MLGIDAVTMKEAFRIKETSAPHVIKYGPLRKHAYVTCKKITGIAIAPDYGVTVGHVRGLIAGRGDGLIETLCQGVKRERTRRAAQKCWPWRTGLSYTILQPSLFWPFARISSRSCGQSISRWPWGLRKFIPNA